MTFDRKRANIWSGSSRLYCPFIQNLIKQALRENTVNSEG